jgi:type III restriction enzyme
MEVSFFDHPILNSPYSYPSRHWELDEEGQPTNCIIHERRRSELITPVPKPQRRRGQDQVEMVYNTSDGLSSEDQEYDPTPIINEIRSHVGTWRNLSSPEQWKVTPETARLLQYWRHHPFQNIRPFFCQVEAVETAIWLTEVAPKMKKRGKYFGTI